MAQGKAGVAPASQSWSAKVFVAQSLLQPLLTHAQRRLGSPGPACGLVFPY